MYGKKGSQGGMATIAVTAALLLTACANVTQSAASNVAPPAVGNDADAHGCRASAGYAWCEHTQRCERPWELAQQKHFALSEANVAHYCATGSAE